ncbi:hypothetical protein CC1G_02623 [Coprinopsis cinerea okayama7|uniref:Uncharacterized protein n=1 Tax=Coprinopsis cinerea (strain Okayama-7 / 130 / ATCC MYA-4618 / FGSC 9003) TaxID=240176 RepID=A8PBD9_COPC7|nr:hypothetical protein CC1G_02623 [Coprinopsis cinerea okayama7\|eukprot:XP_001840160.2 hypothetical protein CC1G_02623 [Coprinopsis cinerea okayama7\
MRQQCAKFNVDILEEASYVLWCIWKDKKSLPACISALAEDKGLYETLKEAHRTKNYQCIQTWEEGRNASFDSVETKVDRFLNELRPDMLRLVDGEIALPSWRPPNDLDEEVVQHLVGLRIPSLKGKPNILLHDLGAFQEDKVLQDRLKNIFMANNHTFLVNTSGSGKTRILLEGLCQNWGFYFTSLVDSSLLGSTDVQNAISTHVPDTPGFRAELPPAGTKTYEDSLKRNRQIASRVFRQVLLARLLLFHLFVTTMDRSTPPQTLRERWLLLQLQPCLLNPRVWDIFHHLARELSTASDAYLNSQTETLLSEVRSILSQDGHMPFFCVLDEAQHAATQHLPAFRSDHNGAHRPILREIVRAWESQCAGQGVFMVVAGTGISKDVVDQAMASAIMKDSRYRWCSDTGAFDSIEVQQRYLRKYFPPKYLGTKSGARLLERVWYWLHGRHRFTAGYVSEAISDGFQRPHTLLNAYIRHFSEFRVTDAQAFVDAEPPLPLPVFSQLKLDFSKLKKNSDMLSTIHQLTTHYLMRSVLPVTLGKDEAIYVEYGFARFVDSETKTVAVDEPLVLLAATHWINKHHRSSYKYFAKQIGIHETTSNGFENYIAYCIDMAFSSATPRAVNSVFNFVGEPPLWTNQTAELVAVHRVQTGGEFESSIVKHCASCGPSVTLGLNAETPEETSSWLECRKYAPMCFPHNLMGPDVLFVLRLEDQSLVWVALQAKYSQGKNGSLVRSSLRKAIKSVTPSEFFMDKDGIRYMPPCHPTLFEDTLKHLKALPSRRLDAGAYSLLRVIVSFPADPKLKRALEEDPDKEGHPIASLNMKLIKQITEKLSPVNFLQTLEDPIQKDKKKRKRAAAAGSPAPKKRLRLKI